MKKYRTQKEIEIVRQAFSSNGNPGTLQKIVNRESGKNKIIEPNKETLIAFYVERNCPNVAKLIEFVVSEGIKSLGSNSIDFLGVAEGPFSIENAMSMQAIHIGNREMMPLVWFAYLAEGFKELPKEQIEAFDEVCQAFSMPI